MYMYILFWKRIHYSSRREYTCIHSRREHTCIHSRREHTCIHILCSSRREYICIHIYTYTCTAYCIWSGISSISHLNRWSSSLGLFCHVPLKRDRGDYDWRLRLNNTPNAIDCTIHTICVCRERCMCVSILSNRLMTIEIEWHSKCNRLYNTHK